MDKYDVFLSHSHTDAQWVEQLATQLQEQGMTPWLDKWEIIPGSSWQQAITKGLNEAKCCVVCLGADKADGWFQKEYEVALDYQSHNNGFRVILVLLTGADPTQASPFLTSNNWIDYRQSAAAEESFHRLISGIRGEKPGPYKPKANGDQSRKDAMETMLADLRDLETKGLLPKKEAARKRAELLAAYFEKPLRQVTIQ